MAPLTAKFWGDGLEDVKKWVSEEDKALGKIPLSVNGRAPRPGDLVKNEDMARVLRSLGAHGATKGFYDAFPGRAIVRAVQKHGGCMTMEDLSEERTKSTFPESISVEYKGFRLHQVPPNGQGIAALIALSGLDALEKSHLVPPSLPNLDGTGWKSSQTWHAMIEMMRLGFADARSYACDQEFCKGKGRCIKTHHELLNPTRICQRANDLFDPHKATVQGAPDATSCTVSFQVVDKQGNAVSFVNSNYMGFGTGLVPDGCGFSLQNRGAGFSFQPGHPNLIEPLKRPFHTIIPAILTHADTHELYATLTNMGGFMQPQGHLQLTLALVAGLDPQMAIDQPRFCIPDGTRNGAILVEEGVPEDIVARLRELGHDVVGNVAGYARSVFGRAQIIKRDRETGVLWAGSDGRSDGCAMGY